MNSIRDGKEGDRCDRENEREKRGNERYWVEANQFSNHGLIVVDSSLFLLT